MIKVCVLRKPGLEDVSELKIDMGDDDPAVVKVSFPAGRSYKGDGKAKKWVARQTDEAAGTSTAGNEAEPSVEGEASPGSSASPPVGGGSGNASESPEGEKEAPERGTSPPPSDSSDSDVEVSSGLLLLEEL
ncbi:hypothetical protein LINPERPRIM_LOCUS5929 [Linum perenne]